MTDTDALTLYATHRDPEAFRHLVEAYQHMVWGVCLRQLAGHEADAADAAQETFLKLARNAGTIRSSVSAWLHACATSTAIDLVRRQGTRRRHESSAAATWGGEHVEDPAWRELRSILDAAIAELGDRPRALVVERYFAGRSQTDLAAEHGISQSMVSREIKTAIALLREKLQHKGFAIAAGSLTAGLAAEASAATAPATLTAGLSAIGVSGAGAATAGTIAAAAGIGFAAKTCLGLAVAAIVVGGLVAAIVLPRTGATPSASNTAAVNVNDLLVPNLSEGQGTEFSRTPANNGARPPSRDDDIITFRNGSVSQILSLAYEIERPLHDERTPVPTSRWDTARPATPTELRQALQDRLGLVAWIEPQRRDVYVMLRPDPTTLALQPSDDEAQAQTVRGPSVAQPGRFEAVGMPDIRSKLMLWLGHPIIDETGLDGRYSLDGIPYRADRSSDAYAAALSDRLGIPIERQERMLDVLVIESVDGPHLQRTGPQAYLYDEEFTTWEQVDEVAALEIPRLFEQWREHELAYQGPPALLLDADQPAELVAAGAMQVGLALPIARPAAYDGPLEIVERTEQTWIALQVEQANGPQLRDVVEQLRAYAAQHRYPLTGQVRIDFGRYIPGLSGITVHVGIEDPRMYAKDAADRAEAPVP